MDTTESGHDGQPVRCRKPPQAVEDAHSTLTKRNAASGDNELNHHCDYFDLDSDGIIWPLDTYQVCRTWGWSFPLALFFAGAIHFVQSYGTIPGITPDPFWRIWKKNIHRNRHGSSSMSFGRNGELVVGSLHAFFVENDRDGKGGLTVWEMWSGLKKQALPFDFFGQVSTFFEWLFAYLLVLPKDGVLREEDARGVCDGSLFRVKAEGSQRRLHSSSLFAKQVLSLFIVSLIIFPATSAGMYYFVLRAADDVIGLCRYPQRTEKESKTPEKSWRGYSHVSKESEERPISAAGVIGVLIVAGITRLILR